MAGGGRCAALQNMSACNFQEQRFLGRGGESPGRKGEESNQSHSGSADICEAKVIWDPFFAPLGGPETQPPRSAQQNARQWSQVLQKRSRFWDRQAVPFLGPPGSRLAVPTGSAILRSSPDFVALPTFCSLGTARRSQKWDRLAVPKMGPPGGPQNGTVWRSQNRDRFRGSWCNFFLDHEWEVFGFTGGQISVSVVGVASGS